jgi:Flp pilus assembly protein TadB
MIAIAGTFGAITFLVVAVAVLYWYGSRNKQLAAQLANLTTRKEAATILAHAIKYLEPMGPGENLEWTNARCILEYAMHETVYGKN